MPAPIIEISDRQTLLEIDSERIQFAIATVLRGESMTAATISVAIVDNQQIQAVNRRYLNHDYATDVISFPLGEAEGPLEGDLMVNAEMARSESATFGWTPQEELLLYIVHGTLHLAGYDDRTKIDRAQMQQKETHYLAQLGIDVSPRAAVTSNLWPGDRA